MKKIEAIIRPSRLEAVRSALNSSKIDGMTITEVKGFGREPGHAEIYRGNEYEIRFITKIKIELVIEDDMVDAVVACICQEARTGHIGDGKILVTPVEQFVRIRTGETALDG
jgi:nitrogen regulatory protein P-II 1